MKHNCPVCKEVLTHKGYSPRKDGSAVRRWHCDKCRHTYGENKLWFPGPVREAKLLAGECLCQPVIDDLKAKVLFLENKLNTYKNEQEREKKALAWAIKVQEAEKELEEQCKLFVATSKMKFSDIK